MKNNTINMEIVNAAARVQSANSNVASYAKSSFGPIKVNKPLVGRVKVTVAGKTVKMSKSDYEKYQQTAHDVGCNLAATMIAAGVLAASKPVINAAEKGAVKVIGKLPGIKKLVKTRTEIIEDELVDDDDFDEDEDV